MVIQLSNSNVTSSAITCRGAEMTLAWKNMVEDNPVPSSFPATDANNEVQLMGWQNPRYKIIGLLDESSDKLSNRMTLSLLKSFAKETTSTYLIEPTMTGTGSQVAIESFDVRMLASEVNNSQIYRYSISLVETL